MRQNSASADFYKEIVESSYAARNNTKVASSTSAEDVQQKLGSLSADQLEVMARELGMLANKTAAEAPEEKAAEQARKEPETEEEKVLKDEAADNGSATPAEDAKQDEAKAEAEKEVKASELLRSILEKSASEEETRETEEALKICEAFEAAESMLKEAGYGVADYVFGLLGGEEGSENIAINVADRAEKLASETGLPSMLVARDLVSAMAEMLQQE